MGPSGADDGMTVRLAVSQHVMPWIAPVCAASLGLWQLGEPSLWIDEAFTAAAIHQSYRAPKQHPLALPNGVETLDDGRRDVRSGAQDTFGRGCRSLGRTPYGLARRLFGAQVALVVAPSRIEPVCSHGRSRRVDTRFCLRASIACTWLFVRVRERDEIPRIVAYTSVALLLVLWPFSGVLLLAVHAFVARRSRRVLLWLAPVALVVAVRVKETHRPGSPLDWLEYPSWFTIFDVVTDVPGGLGLGVILAVVGVRSAAPYRELLVAWAALPFAISLTRACTSQSFSIGT